VNITFDGVVGQRCEGAGSVETFIGFGAGGAV